MIDQNGHEIGRAKVGGRPLQTLSVDQFQWLKIGDICQMLARSIFRHHSHSLPFLSNAAETSCWATRLTVKVDGKLTRRSR
jgi:hypothetical protein